MDFFSERHLQSEVASFYMRTAEYPEGVSVACSTQTQYSGGLAFPATVQVILGAQSGWVELEFWPYARPDKVVIKNGGQTVIDTGYVGDITWQQDLNVALSTEQVEQEQIIQRAVTGTQDEDAPDRIAFFKDATDPTALTDVYAPLGDTAWDFTLSCPGDVGPEDPSELPGLALWLNADSLNHLDDGDRVETWEDNSGNGRHFSQASESNRPALVKNFMGNKSMLYFDGERPDWLERNDSDLKLDPTEDEFTVFMVVYREEDEQGIVIAWREGANQGYAFFHSSNAPWVILAGSTFTQAAASRNELTLWNVAVTEGFANSPVKVNDRPEGSASTGSANMPSAAEPVRVGARGDDNNEPGFPLTGWIGEIIMFDRFLDADERRLIEKYLRRKWRYEPQLHMRPDRIPGLKHWLSASQLLGFQDGDPIPVLPDFSGEGKDATPGDPLLPPIYKEGGLNGQPYLHFENRVSLFGGTFTPTDYTAFFVYRADLTGPTLARAYSHGRASVGFRANGTELSVGTNAASGQATRVMRYTRGEPQQGNIVMAQRVGTGFPSGYTDGYRNVETSITGFWVTSNAIGAANLDMEIYEAFLFDRILSSDERRGLERWAANLYGKEIATNL